MNSKQKCLCCNEYYPSDHRWVVTPRGKFAGYDHIQSFVKAEHARKLFKANNKAQKEKKKVNAKQKREFYANDVSHQHKLTQKVFNKMRVLEEKLWFKERGIKPYCISCGKPNMDWCCSHFKSRGAQGNLRYDRNNTFLACNRYCNMALSGNIEGNKTTVGYKKGLIIRFGEEEGKRIIEYCTVNTQVKKWTGQELKEMRQEFNKQIRELEREI